MGRVFATEHADISGGLIDLGEADAASLLKAIVAGDGENQIALRGGERYIARLQNYTRPEGLPIPEAESYELATTAHGTLDKLTLRPIARRAPETGEVEVRIPAAGLNFRDVLNVMGLYPGDPGPLGGEGAGRITRLGKGVLVRATDIR